MPEAPPGCGELARLGYIFAREIAGLTFLALYYLALPVVLGVTLLRNFRRQMGFGRYTIMILLLLTLLLLPLKMVLCWTLHLNYLVSIPEYFFYF